MRRLRPSLLIPLTVLSILLFGEIAAGDEPEPLTLSVTSAQARCTLGSVTTLEYTIDGGKPPYQLTVNGRSIEQTSEPSYIPADHRRSGCASDLPAAKTSSG